MSTYKDGLKEVINRAGWASGPILVALEDIERLETENAELYKLAEKKDVLIGQQARELERRDDVIKQLEAERDAAVEDMKGMDRYITTSADPCAALCQVCKHKPQVGERCKRCDVHDNTGFDWRGPKDGEKGEEG